MDDYNGRLGIFGQSNLNDCVSHKVCDVVIWI